MINDDKQTNRFHKCVFQFFFVAFQTASPILKIIVERAISPEMERGRARQHLDSVLKEFGYCSVHDHSHEDQDRFEALRINKVLIKQSRVV